MDKSKIKTISRADIQLLEKNPRTISNENKKQLKKSIKKYGLVETLVYNENTGHLVSGHQRLSILDEINKSNDYQVNCVVVNLSEKEEYALCVTLNNTTAQGDWDIDTLRDLYLEYDIDLRDDCMFLDHDILYMDLEHKPYVETNTQVEKVEQIVENKKSILGELRAKESSQNKEQTRLTRDEESGSYIDPINDDYTLTFVFNSNAEKRDLMLKLRTTKNNYLPSAYLFDIASGKYNLFG